MHLPRPDQHRDYHSAGDCLLLVSTDDSFAYPGGGGSYIVATQNLGTRAGLLAGTALMIDYALVVAVGIAAGIEALVSAVPTLQGHTLGLCLFVLFVISRVNLRGIESAAICTELIIGHHCRAGEHVGRAA